MSWLISVLFDVQTPSATWRLGTTFMSYEFWNQIAKKSLLNGEFGVHDSKSNKDIKIGNTTNMTKLR